MTAAIIGGGIAGLTAAHELIKAGERPYLLEPGPIGGMVRSHSVDGFTLECGPNVLVVRPDLRALVEELGLSEALCPPQVPGYGQYVWYRDRAVKVPSGFLKLLRSPLFSFSTKMLLPLKAILPGILPGGAGDYSVREFLSPLIGSHAVDSVLDPVLKGIYGGEVDDLSARTLFPGLWEAGVRGASIVSYMRSRGGGGKPPIAVIRGGIQTLTERLWKTVEPHVQLIPRNVDRIIPADDGKRFRLLLRGAGQIEADGCVVTTAGAHSAPLVAYMSETLSDRLLSLKMASLTVLHLAVPRAARLIPNAFGVLFPGGMPENLLGVMFNSLIFPHVAPTDSHILTVIVGGARASEMAPSEGHLKDTIPSLLDHLLGIKDVRWLSMVHWPGAIPQLSVGHYETIAELDACEAKFPGLVFAGVDRGGVGVSDRIRIAREAVKRFRRSRVEKVV